MGLTLHTPKITTNRFCGPAALSAIVGIDSGTAAYLLRAQNGKRSIKGTSHRDMTATLTRLGYYVYTRYIPNGPTDRITLAKWLKQSKTMRTPGRLFLIAAGHHWLVISGRRYTCGIVREVISIRDKRVKRRARVARVYEIVKP